MNPDEFRNSPSGFLAPTENSLFAFVPNPLPPSNLALEPIINRIASAHTLVGKLAGAGRRFSNPYLLINPLQRKEAVASSGIEGTYTTLHDLFLLELGIDEDKRPRDTREVLNYVRALDYALKSLREIPICTRMILQMHEILLAGVGKHRGGDVPAGKYKRDQNYIGGTSPNNARFIPAPPQEVNKLLSDLENFIHSDISKTIPSLVLIALIHYQFEAIHPFPDGNGRVGRLLIPLLLKHLDLLEEPLLFLSPTIEEYKGEYINHLFEVSRTGDWIGWIDFFLKITEIACGRTVNLVQKLHDLNLEYLDRIQKPQAPALLRRLINSLFEWPVITIPQAARELDVSYPAAKNNIDRLVGSGILEELPETLRPKVYVAPQIIDVLENL